MEKGIISVVTGGSSQILFGFVHSDHNDEQDLTVTEDMSHNSSRLDQAVIQLHIWVQEAATGNVAWTNRVQVLVSPKFIFDDSQYDLLFEKAVKEGVRTFVDNFVTYGM
jgi:hypothetical protein